MTAWIEMITDEDASPRLKALLDHARTPHGTVDTVMRVHSLRPETMNGHVTLYREGLDRCRVLPCRVLSYAGHLLPGEVLVIHSGEGTGRGNSQGRRCH